MLCNVTLTFGFIIGTPLLHLLLIVGLHFCVVIIFVVDALVAKTLVVVDGPGKLDEKVMWYQFDCGCDPCQIPILPGDLYFSKELLSTHSGAETVLPDHVRLSFKSKLMSYTELYGLASPILPLRGSVNCILNLVLALVTLILIPFRALQVPPLISGEVAPEFDKRVVCP